MTATSTILPSSSSKTSSSSLNTSMILSSLTDPLKRRLPPPDFHCGEYLEVVGEDEIGSSPTVMFYCTLPSSTMEKEEEEDDDDDGTANTKLTFACRDRSVGVLETTERKVDQDEMEAATQDQGMDPNFFDAGYTLAGRTGFQVWSATRIMVEALLFPLPPGDGERLTKIQRDLRSSSKTTKILELGAGVGVVSTSLAASTGSQVLLSDLPTLVENSLLPNLKRNQTKKNDPHHHVDRSEGTSNNMVLVPPPPPWLCTASRSVKLEDTEEDDERIVFPIGNKGGWASVCTIDWTKPLDVHVSSIASELDYIIASDCVWLKSMLDALLNTVDALFQQNKEATLLLSFQRRDSSDSNNMFTKIDTIVDSVHARGWTLDCLAWRDALVEGDADRKEVFLLEISPLKLGSLQIVFCLVKKNTFLVMATDNKYDRQLRLWGAKGQQALGDTHVILVGASAAGTETLKNLVLPGIGSFVVVDSGTVTPQDASSNFFLPQLAVGNSKAETACQFLQELNPDVSGSHQTLIGTAMPTTEEGWKIVLEPQIFKSKNCLLIAADVPPMCLEGLADFCYHSQNNLPMLVVRSYGLMGCVRLQLPPRGMALLEPKPTNAPPDLRLVNSFPAFVQLSDSIDLTTLDSQQHGHVPYPILLYKAAQAYRQKNDNKLPSSFTEKQDFKTNYLQAMSRDLDKELNFQEAVANAYLAYTERDLTTPDNLDDGSSKLTCLYKALAIFLKEYSNGRPPLNGSIPDMTASTELYVKLQTIYKKQAEKDIQTMTEIVSNLNLPQTIDQDDIANFCANVYAVGQMSTRSILQELDSTPSDSEMVDEWKMTLMDPYEVPVHTPLLWYLGLQACHLFCKQEGRHPGIVDNDADWKTDIPTMTAIYQQQILPLYQLTDQTSDDMLLNPTNVSKICEELTRYGNAEVHAVASVVGGVASQEAVKIITGQYIPVDNTYVYNGIVSVGGVYKF